MFLIIRIKYQKHRRFTLPVPVWVVDVFLEALSDLAWIGEGALKHLPVPDSIKAGNSLRRFQEISLYGILSASHNVLKDLNRYQGLDIADMETGDVQVKISLK